MKHQFFSNALTLAVFKGFAANSFRKIFQGDKSDMGVFSDLGKTTIMTLPFDIMNPCNVIMFIE